MSIQLGYYDGDVNEAANSAAITVLDSMMLKFLALSDVYYIFTSAY